MNPDYLIIQAKKNGNVSAELEWYLEEYQDAPQHPWEKHFEKLYLSFKISMPSIPPQISVKNFIGLIISIYEYELVECDLPNTYRIKASGHFIDNEEYAESFYVSMFESLVRQYFELHEKGKLDELSNVIANEVTKWNWIPFVKQEQIHNLLFSQIELTMKEADISEKMIPVVLADYYQRRDRNQLDNLRRFTRKVEEIIRSSKPNGLNIQYLETILENIRDGGLNLESSADLHPLYQNIQKN